MGKTRVKPEVPARLKDVPNSTRRSSGDRPDAAGVQAHRRRDGRAGSTKSPRRGRGRRRNRSARGSRSWSGVIGAFVDVNRPLFTEKRARIQLRGGGSISSRISVSKSTLEKPKTFQMKEVVRHRADRQDRHVRLARGAPGHGGRPAGRDKFFYEVKEDAVAERVSGTRAMVSA